MNSMPPSDVRHTASTGTLVPLPARQDNYIWLAADSGHAVIVDPGAVAPVLSYLADHALQLSAILLTHHHPDHVDGVLELAQATGAPVYGPATEQLPRCDVPLREGDSVILQQPAIDLQVIDVPGHTAGHIAYFGIAAGHRVLFCGDTLFSAGCGRLLEGTPRQMRDSLAKLADLPRDTLVCCGHEYTLANLRWARTVDPGNTALAEWEYKALQYRQQNLPTLPTSLALEYAINPFLRLSDLQVQHAAQAWARHALTYDVDVFSALREWKNAF